LVSLGSTSSVMMTNESDTGRCLRTSVWCEWKVVS
jgi:hypothetical protein